jgi:hypothetical protein
MGAFSSTGCHRTQGPADPLCRIPVELTLSLTFPFARRAVPFFGFVLVNESTAKELDAATLAQTADAFRVDLNSRFGPTWGSSVNVRAASSIADVSPVEVAIVTRWQESGASLAGWWLSSDHEMKEILGDAPANRWATMADGVTMQALETCDRVQDTSYTDGAGIVHANFLLPAAFDPGAPPPYDFLGLLAEPEGMTQGGYMIQQAGGAISDVSPPKLARKGLSATRNPGMHVWLVGKERLHHCYPSSRVYKRGVRLSA